VSIRARNAAAVALLVAGLIALVGGVVSLYAKERVLDAERFADEAVATLDDPDMRRFVSLQLTNRVIARIDPDLVTVKPLIESAVGTLLDTDALRAAIRQGILVAHRAIFENEVDEAVVRAADVGELLRGALAAVDPALEHRIPTGFDATIVRLADSPAAVDAAQAADDLTRLASLLVPLAIVLIAGSALLAAGWRWAAVRAGIAMLAVAAALVVALAALRAAVLDRIADETRRGAASSVWEQFIGDLGTWFAFAGAAGVLLIVLATFSLSPSDLGSPVRRAWDRVRREPGAPAPRLAWALALGLSGAALVLAADRLLRLLVIVAGVYLLARGLAALVGVLAQWRGWSLEPPEAAAGEKRGGDRPATRRALAVAGLAAVATAVVVGASLALLIDDPGAAEPRRTPAGECNGSATLCERRLNQVAFLGTHNSHAGSGYPGFLFPGQEGTIPSQLENGVRGLWIDTYYGADGERVYTLTDRIDPALNAQLKQELGPRFEAAAARLRADIAKPPPGAPQRIYLCHGYCELGAVEARETFEQIASFLERNPEEVLLIDIEDYTAPAETAALIESSGLGRYVYKGPAGPPWPTLGEMVDSGGRVLVVAEHRTSGAPSWYRRAYSLFQETPFDFKAPAEMSCRPNRGSQKNSLFLINNWISTDPTPKPSNAAVVNAHDFLLGRARRCQRERGRFPNVLNVDFYGRGDAAAVVARLNGGSQ
jgi:hypothetical protein